MVTTTGLLTVTLAWLNYPWAAIGSLYGVNLNLSNPLWILGEIFTDAGHRLDHLHSASVYTSPPGVIKGCGSSFELPRKEEKENQNVD